MMDPWVKDGRKKEERGEEVQPRSSNGGREILEPAPAGTDSGSRPSSFHPALTLT